MTDQDRLALADELRAVLNRSGREWAYFPLIERAEKAIRTSAQSGGEPVAWREALVKLPPAETMLGYASILEKPKFDIRNGIKYPLPNGEPTIAAIAALRLCAALASAPQPAAGNNG